MADEVRISDWSSDVCSSDLLVVNATNSYPGNLPPELEHAKLAALTEAIAGAFGARPVVYKAGRYGVGPATAGILEALGYRIDVSVVPFTDFSEDRKSTRLNSSHYCASRMPFSASKKKTT